MIPRRGYAVINTASSWPAAAPFISPPHAPLLCRFRRSPTRCPNHLPQSSLGLEDLEERGWAFLGAERREHLPHGAVGHHHRGAPGDAEGRIKRAGLVAEQVKREGELILKGLVQRRRVLRAADNGKALGRVRRLEVLEPQALRGSAARGRLGKRQEGSVTGYCS